jgi:hypothetical protein
MYVMFAQVQLPEGRPNNSSLHVGLLIVAPAAAGGPQRDGKASKIYAVV